MDWGAGGVLRPGRYRIYAGDRFLELEVGARWAALTARPTDTQRDGPRLTSAGFAPPASGATSPTTRAWVRSWSFQSAGERAATEAAIERSVRAALGVADDRVLTIQSRPAYEGDPRMPVVILFGSLYLGFAIVVDWLVLLAWDVVVPSRAHLQAAARLQIAAPLIAVALFVAWVVFVPRIRLAVVSRRRAPAAAEIDLRMPAVTIVGILAPPRWCWTPSMLLPSSGPSAPRARTWSSTS